MKIILSHPTGNQNVRAIIKSLAEDGVLAEFNTTLAINSRAAWLKLLPEGIRKECQRRTFPIPLEKIKTHAALELFRMLLPKIGLNRFVKHEQGFACVDAVYRNFDKAVSKRLPLLAKKNDLKAVYAYEDAALSTFTRAKTMGLKRIYDLPIAYWQTGHKLMTEEAQRLPSWAGTLGGGITDSADKLERKTRELELADLVVVSSQFVLDSLPDAIRACKEIVIVPFGSPKTTVEKKKGEQEKNGSSYPLRVLFVGSLSQRKGLGDLFAAMKLLNSSDVELIIMGSLQAPMDFYRQEYPDFIYEPGRAHEEVLALMRCCDVFCLPSIVEGRALVMQEAMSQGLPLIITPNTGGSDLIIDGESGFLVPIRSPYAIAEKITWFLENREKIPNMRHIAKTHAATYTWVKYGKKLLEEFEKL